VVRGIKRPLPFRDEYRETAQVHQEALRTMDLDAQLHRLLGPNRQFQGHQREALTAIVHGKTPLLYVAPTGSRKSLLFLLPASYDRHGTTLVITPLISLRQDLLRRCQELSITCREWSSRTPPDAAQIVLATPESFQTNGFQFFLHRLRTT